MDFCILQRIIKVKYTHDTNARVANIKTWAYKPTYIYANWWL